MNKKWPHTEREHPVDELIADINDNTCRNCGHEANNKYCPACGQKKIDEDDYSLRHFLGHALHEFTHFDSKIFRSYKYLLFKPGKMTDEYLAGKRGRYMNPIQLFIITNVIFFFVTHFMGSGNINIFATPLSVHEQFGNFRNITTRLVTERLHKTHETHALYEENFNHKMRDIAKSLVIVMIPIFSACTFILYWRARRYYVQHLVYALHFFTFVLLSLITIVPVALIIYEMLAPALHLNIQNEDPFFFFFYAPLLFFYINTSSLKTFKKNIYATFLRSILLIVALGYVFSAYRFILFLSVYTIT